MKTSENNNIQQLKNGNQEAFEKLFREYYARLCAYSFLIVKDKDAAAEIVQDFFVKLWENRAKLEIVATQSYFFKAIHNNSIKYMGKKVDFEPITSGKEYGFEMQNDFELQEKMEQSLNELPPKCREIFILSRMEKLRHNEIAEKLGISAKTVEVQIRKANIILKEKLKEFYFLLLFLFFI